MQLVKPQQLFAQPYILVHILHVVVNCLNKAVTHGSYTTLVKSPDRVLRKSAFDSMYHTYESFRNTAAAVLSSQVKTLVFRAKARKYDNTLQAALDGTEVPESVYHSLIEAVHDNMEYMYKYVTPCQGFSPAWYSCHV